MPQRSQFFFPSVGHRQLFLSPNFNQRNFAHFAHFMGCGADETALTRNWRSRSETNPFLSCWIHFSIPNHPEPFQSAHRCPILAVFPFSLIYPQGEQHLALRPHQLHRRRLVPVANLRTKFHRPVVCRRLLIPPLFLESKIKIKTKNLLIKEKPNF